MQPDSSYHHVSSFVKKTVQQFYHLTRRYIFFHLLFITLITCQLISLLFLIPLMAKNVAAAIVIATTFLTTFTYLVLRFYFQTRKVEQLLLLKNNFVHHISHLFPIKQQEPKWSLEEVSGIYHFIHHLHYDCTLTHLLSPLAIRLIPGLDLLASWCLWQNTLWMQEALHRHAIMSMINWVKLYPLDLELHQTLATAYMAFYSLYRLPHTHEKIHPLIARQYDLAEMKAQVEKIAKMAIEELEVLIKCDSNPVWALKQMGKIYHDLKWKHEEKKIYETLLSLHQKESDIMYFLGVLCFELGDTAQGLHLYSDLQKMDPTKAESLILHYAGEFSL